ncbi:Survival motor neuron interacting protein 1 [Heracleum sosnowskyi]|uniref:Survival motor neuron interacting protein 1 n=1 Tax=Heracleum sosnowskyi TaxID=360622 RepID=A0AAD8N262_9APIA|nr:Survival motor neuron interacting protein 1 [Heracleum sosnowskyi]
MGRNLGPVLRRELDNLGKDGDCRKSAMKALKSYVKELDSKTIPFFLAQVSERKETSSSAGEYSISLYEVLARVHGPKIVPFIDIIMTTIRNTLISSGSSFALHQACSKVVSAIARYGIDPTTPENKKREIIHSLCKPLSDSILVSQENLSFGSAFCLKALVDSDNWRFASSEMVNEVCQRVAGALEKPMQTNSHMGLVMALAKSNSLVVEAYARLFIQSGLRILSAGVAEDNSQKRLLAIQMVNFLMKYLDPRSLFSELEFIMEEMQKCQADKMSYVKGAAFDALQTAKTIASEQGSNFEGDTGSVSESNFYRNNDYGRRMSDAVDGIPNFTSPEPQILNSFAEYDFPVESAFSNGYASGDLDYDRRVNCQLWRKFENGGLDLSFKDGLFTEATSKSLMENTEENECSENRVSANEFAGFLQESSRSAGVRSMTPSPQRLRSHISVDDIKIFTTPRKLIYSLQESSSENSNVSKKQTRRLRSPCKSKFELSLSKGEQTSFSHHPASMYDQYGFLRNVKQKTRSEENMSLTGEDFHVKHMTRSEENLSLTGVDFHGSSESVSSSEPEAVGNIKVSQRLDSAFQTESHKVSVRKHYPMPLRSMFCGVIILVFTAFMCFFWIGSDQDKSYYLPPT